MPLEGKILGGRYEILRRLGGGGMATVYLAQDQFLQRQVAVKVMNESLSHDRDFVRRFAREAKAAAIMSHSNVVNVYDVGREGSVHYMVMEYMEGASLIDLIEGRGALSEKEAVSVTIQICDGLAHAHEKGIVHRDIKPHNIMSTAGGQFKLGDFGISRLNGASTITQTGFVMGSVHYFSPEQAKGRNISHQSDLYSLGVVLFYMVTGKLPYDGEEAIAIALKHLQEPIPDPRLWKPELSEGLCHVITRSMAKSTDERYQTAEEMKADLERALTGFWQGTQPFAIPPEPEITKYGLSEGESSYSSGSIPSRMKKSGRNASRARRPWQRKRLWFAIGIALLLFIFVVNAIQGAGNDPIEAYRDPVTEQQQADTGDSEGPEEEIQTEEPEPDREKADKKPEEESAQGNPAQPPEEEKPENEGYNWQQDRPSGADNSSFRSFSRSGSGGSYDVQVDVNVPPEQQVRYDVYLSDRNGKQTVSRNNPVQVDGDGQNFTRVSFPVSSDMPDGDGIIKIRLYRIDPGSDSEVDATEYLLEQIGG
ncbi:protein kinase domain-containing protein [Salinithrix halophila]|uniref:Protein kinase n=1 Tax=Salinithrix halophila TaxID=1485204 RepID=A0ABV8JK74_9BACL